MFIYQPQVDHRSWAVFPNYTLFFKLLKLSKLVFFFLNWFLDFLILIFFFNLDLTLCQLITRETRKKRKRNKIKNQEKKKKRRNKDKPKKRNDSKKKKKKKKQKICKRFFGKKENFWKLKQRIKFKVFKIKVKFGKTGHNFSQLSTSYHKLGIITHEKLW